MTLLFLEQLNFNKIKDCFVNIVQPRCFLLVGNLFLQKMSALDLQQVRVKGCSQTWGAVCVRSLICKEAIQTCSENALVLQQLVVDGYVLIFHEDTSSYFKHHLAYFALRIKAGIHQLGIDLGDYLVDVAMYPHGSTICSLLLWIQDLPTDLPDAFE